MEAEYPQINPLLLCSRRRKREEDEGGLELLLSMDLDEEETRSEQQAPPRVPDKLKAVSQELGHDIRIFTSTTFELMTSKLSKADQEEDDDFYELQPSDYYKLISNRLAEQSKVLKTRKIREAELAAQRARLTKAVARVRFPDGYILEAEFHPSETVHSLVDLLMKVIARPDLPFYLYTVPPKKRIMDTSQDFYTIGFVPGANVFFSYDLPEGSELNTDAVKSGPYLREEIRTLDGLSLQSEPSDQPDDSKTNSDSAHQSYAFQSDSAPAAANKKSAKPKWFKR
ncbi:plant UBX domain-containing protein 1-like [Triticum dicoccoides]|uniref:plant UBX domain-containing protein 1-like n=1 Tax=Triticum dicoccoides TaxID=85692 RepID=UPI000E794655|nr:plant UBX domain-containing protein 1-like [Triticum dicoccoides]